MSSYLSSAPVPKEIQVSDFPETTERHRETTISQGQIPRLAPLDVALAGLGNGLTPPGLHPAPTYTGARALCPAPTLALSLLWSPFLLGQVPETSLSSPVVNDRRAGWGGTQDCDTFLASLLHLAEPSPLGDIDSPFLSGRRLKETGKLGTFLPQGSQRAGHCSNLA